MSKFIFDNISQVNYNKSNDKYKKTVFKYTKLFSFDNDSLKSLYNNYRPSYKKLAEKNFEHDQIFEIEEYNNDYITLDNSFVNNNGVIITSNKEIFINGGCLCGNTSFSFKKNIIMVNNVISITSMWSDGIWHFPFESFVSLMSIPEDILHKSKIHVAKISNYVIQWFEFLNIPVSQLITGVIFAKTLHLPRMGLCGSPYFSQINWLKDIVSTKNNNLLNMPDKYIILIKRNNRRRLKNYNELEILLKKFCEQKNLYLYVHDDGDLPPLVQQQQIFSKAIAVFAPHGAGGINIISMKDTAWYIEFLSIEDINICYSRLAYLCNINYKGISMSNLTIDLNKINEILITLQLNYNN